jgi:chromatin remodeling complex protein RSC6
MSRELKERDIDIGGRLRDFGAPIREKADEFLARTKEAVKQATKQNETH